MPFSEIAGGTQGGIVPRREQQVDRLLSVILILVIIVAISTTIYVIASPRR